MLKTIPPIERITHMYELVSPVKPLVVLKYLSILVIGAGAMLLVPLIVALYFSEYTIAGTYILIGSVIILLGSLFHRLLPEGELEWKEALIIAAVIFPFAALLSAIPFTFSAGMPFLDAYFEAVSGVTTTGLSVAPATVGPAFLFARSWLQWVGGIGIIIIILMVFIPPGTSAHRLYAINSPETPLRPGVTATAKLLVQIYCLLTVVSFLILVAGGMPAFDAVCHALSAVSTGGFSTRADSAAGFAGLTIPFLITISCLMGAFNFSLYPRIIKDKNALLSDIQFRYFLLFAAIGILLVFFTLTETMNPAEGLSVASFQVISALSTAGFSTVDIGTLPDGTKAVLTVLMWVGGSVGSTAGGIKILRLVILLKVVHLVFIRYFLPREALTPLKLGKDVIETEMVYNILTFVFLYSLVLVCSSFLFMLYGFSLDNALFEVSSALGTVGLSCGITSAAMPDILKGVLIIDMLLGRIEIVPLLILAFPRTWVKK
ncbi:TrkH family potassium uptake protein [Methanogenium organophilum]|uniref:TrkH family potassium uptake protein n=1 Tax=Methanogenium organophilum TaxID=2199 RepID=A0A9X9S2D1_METOG|nr:TrkH family potassium uptake protein [Methanogenium organophilum]WAI00466.1 TrkH family potassium uptake protein [Methanogenium organophilum]